MLFNAETFRFVLAYSLLAFGLGFVSAGFVRLMGFGLLPHARALAAHSARIGQKALSDDITRIAQAASQLSESVNNLLRTSAGVGAFLIFIGILFLSASYSVMFVLPA
ncbi:MAG: hypothetical protein FJ030_05145 [Chloroflexi bacterium]|nr:hypothetical protein [Chloroflexota bacterium]